MRVRKVERLSVVAKSRGGELFTLFSLLWPLHRASDVAKTLRNHHHKLRTYCLGRHWLAMPAFVERWFVCCVGKRARADFGPGAFTQSRAIPLLGARTLKISPVFSKGRRTGGASGTSCR